jgi:hypothetical protein
VTKFVFSIQSRVEFTLKDLKLTQEQWDKLSEEEKEEVSYEHADQIFRDTEYSLEVKE